MFSKSWKCWEILVLYILALPTPEEKQEVDARSVYVGNVRFASETAILKFK
jgi:hypothetical protein